MRRRYEIPETVRSVESVLLITVVGPFDRST